jgi:two-component system nitrogen regulation response regulator GlnG
LRERGDDVNLLAEHFVRTFSRELSKDVRQISAEAMDVLKRYPWPGNVRELQSVVKQSLLQATGPVLLPAFLPLFLSSAPSQASSADETAQLVPYIRGQLQAGTTSLYADVQAITDRCLFTEVLTYSAGNLSRAAKYLGISRATLRNRLTALGLSADEFGAEH